MWSRFLRDYLTYSRKERWGIYTLLLIIISCILLPFLFPFILHEKKYDSSQLDSAVSRLRAIEDSNAEKAPQYQKYIRPAGKRHSNPRNNEVVEKFELFPFNPNTISEGDWKRLGVPQKTILTIQKYISKGGHFYKASDIGKIWGLHEDEINRLIPFVHIDEVKAVQRNTLYQPYKPYRKPEIQPFDINTTDSAQLDDLPGIGSHLAKRIIAFREKLGGFSSVDQVSETFGLPDSTFRKIKPKLFIGTGNLRKIDLNTASLDNLRTHPYIRYALANAIVQYRTQHGRFDDVSGIKNIMLVSDTLYQKLSPYLTATHN